MVTFRSLMTICFDEFGSSQAYDKAKYLGQFFKDIVSNVQATGGEDIEDQILVCNRPRNERRAERVFVCG